MLVSGGLFQGHGVRKVVIVRRGLLPKHASERRVILEACNNYSRWLNYQQRMAQK